jgi:hypothetical protein
VPKNKRHRHNRKDLANIARVCAHAKLGATSEEESPTCREGIDDRNSTIRDRIYDQWVKDVPSKCRTRWLDVVRVSRTPSSAEGCNPRMCKLVVSVKEDWPVNSTRIERRGTTPDAIADTAKKQKKGK